MGSFSDVRKGKNVVYDVGEAGMAAFLSFTFFNFFVCEPGYS